MTKQTAPAGRKALLIVESPAKAKTINKYLGKDFVVEASVGHIKNLPKSKLGVDLEHDYAPTFQTIEGKEDIVEKLRTTAAGSSAVYIATDPDREGEAIAADIAEEISDKNAKIFRVLFHEITPHGIEEAMKKPSSINENLVASQRARRVMDRIVGYKVSPIIWKTFFYGLSAGRVQSVALRLICERENEIKAFSPTPYWSIIGEFAVRPDEPFFAKLVSIGGKDLIVPAKDTLADIQHRGLSGKTTWIASEEDAQRTMEDVRKQNYAITSVQKRETRRNPLPPFITSTLQQEASRKLGLSASRTMKLAQKLYEGIDLGPEGLVGLITYMRTDSTRLSDESVTAAREFIGVNYGKEYLPPKPNVYKKRKTSQDAHEAIRPTSVKHTPSAMKKHLEKDLYRLYELIWNRFVACQMEAARMETTTVIVEGGIYRFKATSSRYTFRGFLQVYDDAIERESAEDAEDPEVVDERLPASLAEGQSAALKNAVTHRHETSPPPRYTESSLVKTLEALGIGRPSTYALIVGTIIDRKYVEQRDRKLYALDLGQEVSKLLSTHFPHVFNVKFTARMEEELDTIAGGTNDYRTVLNDFFLPFSESLEKVSTKTTAIKKSLQVQTEEACSLCGKPMLIKWGRNGRFMACSGYPACKNTHPLPEDQEKHQHLAGLKCELCGGDMLVRTSRFGTFLGCSNYPACKNTKPISMGVKCPKCKQGDVIERKTKRKRTFYGCSRYPECDFASWDKPVDKKCDTCGNDYMVVKFSQKRGEYYKCPSCKAEVAKEEQSVAAAG
ncbi:MAG TPA: type I DNA topoisomerase [Bacteroidota bacterium]|nr:type I DNA topoisomerase [Bacteroidota bacterium]